MAMREQTEIVHIDCSHWISNCVVEIASQFNLLHLPLPEREQLEVLEVLEILEMVIKVGYSQCQRHQNPSPLNR
jgi:hypothetical protein